MPKNEELQPFLANPREDLAVEYKNWLDLSVTSHKATLAKAVMALANHGGGFIVIGFEDQRHELVAVPRPDELPEVTQDAVSAAVKRFLTPEFHCEVHHVPHPVGQATHPIIVVPSNITEPVMSLRDCDGVFARNRCYMRKPGPRSEEPQSAEEWRALLRRCVLAGRDEMLDAIRSVVAGRVDHAPLPPSAKEELSAFCSAARDRWNELTETLPKDHPARMPDGYFEQGFTLVGAKPASNLAELKDRLESARQIKLTGWSAFLSMHTPEWAPYAHGDFIEAWVGRPSERDPGFGDSAHSDFWRASRDGKLYSIRGYNEDCMPDRLKKATAIDVTLPIWRVGEGLLFAARLAEKFEDVEAIGVECRFTGLMNRYLTSVSGMRAAFNDRFSRSDEVFLTVQATVEQVRDNLVEVMRELLAPLYERFDFFPLSTELVETELGRLRGGRF